MQLSLGSKASFAIASYQKKNLIIPNPYYLLNPKIENEEDLKKVAAFLLCFSKETRKSFKIRMMMIFGEKKLVFRGNFLHNFRIDLVES